MEFVVDIMPTTIYSVTYQKAIEQIEKIEYMQKQLNLLQTTITNLDHASDIPLYSVALKRIPAHYVISVRGIIRTPDKEAELWERLVIFADMLIMIIGVG